MGTLTIAAAQFAPVDDTAANLETVRTAAAKAVSRGADLLVTPEYTSYFTAEIDDRFVASAEPLDGPFVTGLQDIARSAGIALVVGVAERAEVPGRFRNTLVAIGADGTLATTYRKVHLYDAFGSKESDRIEAGDPEQTAVFELDGIRIGLETCYDLRFPEVTRRLAAPEVGAADVVLVPAEWVRGRARNTTGGRSSRRGPSRTPSGSSASGRPRRSASVVPSCSTRRAWLSRRPVRHRGWSSRPWTPR